MTSSLTQPPYPLHPSIKDKLDPTYVSFYNAHIYDKQQVHLQPISASRSSGILIPGGGSKLSVGKTEDIKIHRRETDGPDIPIRIFTPEGERPKNGWPVMVWYHGGGWVLGDIETENTISPENPYPAAVHDAWEALLWLHSTGITQHSLDASRCAIGGSSAGGNLTAIMCHKALASPSLVPSFLTQLLIVPVTDNSASLSTHVSWAENEYVCALPAVKMMWYRKHYLPDAATWAEPEASPLLYAGGWTHQPKALVVVGELDVLRTEGEMYAEKLRDSGVNVDLKIMKGMPHPFVAMDGVLQQGRDTITYMVQALQEAFA